MERSPISLGLRAAQAILGIVVLGLTAYGECSSPPSMQRDTLLTMYFHHSRFRGMGL